MPEMDVSAVVNPWQAACIIVLILVVLGGPQLLAWRNSVLAKDHAKRGADEIEHQSRNNSGSTMKDSLDRIEAELKRQGVEQVSQGERITDLESTVERRGTLTKRKD